MYKVLIAILILLIIFYVLRRNQAKISDETFVSGGMGSRGRTNSGGAGHVTGYSAIRPSHHYVFGGAEMQARPRLSRNFSNPRSTQSLRSLSKTLGPSTPTPSFRPSSRPFSRPSTNPDISTIPGNASVPTNLTLVNSAAVIRPGHHSRSIPRIPIHSVQQVHTISPVQQVHPISPVQPIYYPSGVPGTVVVYENQAVPVDAASYAGQIGFLTNYVDQMYLPLIRENSLISGRYLFYTIVENTAVPVWADGVNCTDDQGCEHLQNLQQVYVPQFDRTFSVVFYNQ